MQKPVDPFRFVDWPTRKLIETWSRREPSRPIPWTPLPRPLAECTVALVSTGGIARNGHPPFDQEGERRNPWWGDPSHRVIRADDTESDVSIYHLHIETSYAEKDLNCMLPLQRLRELSDAGLVGRVAPSHYSFMGYILKPDVLIEETTPKIVAQMKREEVEAAILVPV